HESIIERGKVLQAVRAVFLEALKEKDLMARIERFQQFAELTHGVAAGRNGQNIVYEPFDELMRHIVAGQEPLGDCPRSEVLVKGDGLRGERNRISRGNCHPSCLRAQTNVRAMGSTLPKALGRVKVDPGLGAPPVTDPIAALCLRFVERGISTSD